MAQCPSRGRFLARRLRGAGLGLQWAGTAEAVRPRRGEPAARVAGPPGRLLLYLRPARHGTCRGERAWRGGGSRATSAVWYVIRVGTHQDGCAARQGTGRGSVRGQLTAAGNNCGLRAPGIAVPAPVQQERRATAAPMLLAAMSRRACPRRGLPRLLVTAGPAGASPGRSLPGGLDEQAQRPNRRAPVAGGEAGQDSRSRDPNNRPQSAVR